MVKDEKRDEKTAAELPLPRPVIPSEELFRGVREVWIEHEGIRYLLRITRRNKLILQK
jgi:hemin uptake protein HemP